MKKFKKTSALVLLFSLTLVVASSSAIAEGPNGNARKGKFNYRKVYKMCQERGEVQSNKPVLNPDAKTQSQWNRLFEKKDFKDLSCAEEWNALTENDLNNIHAYLYEHAADSPTPAKCE